MKSSSLTLSLFLDFARISSVTLGGGAVMLPLMEEAFVKKRQWLTETEMIGIFSIVQTLPGIIATNAAVLIGKKVAGAKGAAAAVAGVVLPPTIIMMLFAGVVAAVKDYPPVEAAFTGVRAGSAALILVVLARIGKKTFKNFRDVFIAVGAFILLRVFGVNAVLIVLLSAAVGFLLSFLPQKKDKTDDPA
jgi:chromate transporter